MSLFNYYIKRGISQGIGRAIGGAVEKAIAPAANDIIRKTIAPVADQAAQNINQAAGQFQTAAEMAAESERTPSACPNCGHQNEEGTRFCCECGTRLPELTKGPVEAKQNFCTNCGHEYEAGMKFCIECGNKLEQ